MFLAVLLSVVAGVAAGGAAGYYLTRSSYTAKLATIRSELLKWEGHAVMDVRTLATRIKALL